MVGDDHGDVPGAIAMHSPAQPAQRCFRAEQALGGNPTERNDQTG